MIVSLSTDTPYKTIFTDGKREGFCDTTPDKGGGGSGFRPHDLLEAAVACCLNMNFKMFADKNKISLDEVKVSVALNRDDPGETAFECRVELKGDLGPEERQMMAGLGACAVSTTLSKKITFRCLPTVISSGNADKPSDRPCR